MDRPKKCPDCELWTCFPLIFLTYLVRNRFICRLCGRCVDRFGHRIKRRMLR